MLQPDSKSWTTIAELALVVALSALALGFGVWDVGLASGYVDPVSKAGSQDEAVYAHAALEMARGSGWLTPTFLERFMLNKPPLLMWAGAAAVRAFGISAFALRLASLLAGIATCALLFLWMRRSRAGLSASLAAVVLMLSDPVFHSMSRRFMTDALLAFWFAAAMYLLYRSPRLERRGSALGIGLLSGAAIMTKSIAGLLPLAVLAVYYALAARRQRPRIVGLLLAFASALVLALPWHLYQLLVHRQWFLAEYVQMQIVDTGSVIPWQQSIPAQLSFHGRRLLAIDPFLAFFALVGLAALLIRLRRPANEGDRTLPRLLAAWFVVMLLALVLFRYQSFHYILPLVPAFAMLAVIESPLFRGRRAGFALAALGVLFFAKAYEKDAPWRLDFDRGTTVRAAPALTRYCQQQRDNELVLVSPDDEFYSAVLDLPFVRYIQFAPVIDSTKMSGHVYELGLALPAARFLDLPRWRGFYGERLKAWGLTTDRPVGTTIIVASEAELIEVIRASPERDFFLPESHREGIGRAALPDHTVTAAEAGRFFLLADRSSRRSAGGVPRCEL